LISAIGRSASTTGFNILSPIFSKSLHVECLSAKIPTAAAAKENRFHFCRKLYIAYRTSN
jgi:hypothetical protein